MAVYLCHLEPDLLAHDATVLDSRPGAVLLSKSALHPGGGGQESDLGLIEHRGGRVRVVAVESGDAAGTWVRLEDPELAIADADVVLRVDPERRRVLAALHTDTHILNALVFERFEGALVTGASISADGTARMDFDLPDIDPQRLAGLDDAVNDVISAGLHVTTAYVPAGEAATTPGLIRSASVAPPPTESGELRVVEIAGLDRQACGGTHLANTSESPPVVVTKIENKGRHNRRVRLRLLPGDG